MSAKFLKFACVGLAVFGAVAGVASDRVARAQEASSAVLAQSGLEPLTLVTSSGRHVFQVEAARNDAQREKGLMFRRNLPPDRGMLFDFKTSQPVMMWMKNTYIPLDMVFISRAGQVTHIAKNAEPLSERIIPSDGPAYAVLEINGGAADRIGLKPGDKVENGLFKP